MLAATTKQNSQIRRHLTVPSTNSRAAAAAAGSKEVIKITFHF